VKTYHHNGNLKQSSEKACWQVSIYPGAHRIGSNFGNWRAMMRGKQAMQDGFTSLPLQRRVHCDIFPETGVKWYYYFFNRRKRILTRKIAQARKRRGRSFNFWKTRCSDENKQWDEMKKGRWASPAGKKGVWGPCCCCCCCCCCGPSSKKGFRSLTHGPIRRS
jgi:hypothetical protein